MKKNSFHNQTNEMGKKIFNKWLTIITIDIKKGSKLVIINETLFQYTNFHSNNTICSISSDLLIILTISNTF